VSEILCVVVLCQLTKLYYIINLKKLLQVGILTFYRASVSSPFNRSPCLSAGIKIMPGYTAAQKSRPSLRGRRRRDGDKKIEAVLSGDKCLDRRFGTIL
jgi:hypothetical protein